MHHADLRDAVLLALPPNAVLLNNASGVAVVEERRIRYGLGRGTADLIGYTSVNGLAIFTAIELKQEGERARSAQLRFLRAVATAGGIAAIVRRVSDVPLVFNTPCAGVVWGENP